MFKFLKQRLSAASLVALACAFILSPASARESNNNPRPKESKAYVLDDIIKRPYSFLNREVFFYCRFATESKIFNLVNTRFNPQQHVNFAVWPDKSLLWEKEGRRSVLPTLFVHKANAQGMEELRRAKKYQLLAVTGQIYNDYADLPWILVTKIQIINRKSADLSEAAIQHMEAGIQLIAQDRGAEAARHLERAKEIGVPEEYCGNLYSNLAKAYLSAEDLGTAQLYLKQAIAYDPTEVKLRLAMADICLRMGDNVEAVENAQVALNNSGSRPQAYGIMAEACASDDKFVSAYKNLNMAAATPGISAREKAMLDVRRARIYLLEKRYADADKSYATAVAGVLGSDSWLHKEYGLFYESRYLAGDGVDMLKAAAAQYGRAAELDSADPDALCRLGEMQFQLAQLQNTGYAAVRATIEKIYSITPEYTPARILEGMVLFAEGEPQKADDIFQAIAPQITSNSDSMLALAVAYYDQGLLNEARRAANTAVELQPWKRRPRIIRNFLDAACVETTTASTPTVIETPAPADPKTKPATPLVKPAPVQPDPQSTSFRQAPVSRATAKLSSAAPSARESVDMEQERQDSIFSSTTQNDVISSDEAFASVHTRQDNGIQASRQPRAARGARGDEFTFSPDPSPTLIDSYSATVSADAGSDATHNTLYPGRPRNSNRSAEILMETEAYSAMAGVGADADEGNDSPKVHRTEVILPTAPASIGSSHPDDGGVRWW